MKRFNALCSVISSLTLLASIFLLLSNPAAAQEDVLRPRRASTLFKPVTIGLEGGLNFNLFSQTITQTPVIPESFLNALKSGSGISPYVGIVIDLPLSSSLALQVRGTYDSKTFGNKQSAKFDCPGVVSGVEVIDVDVEYTVTANYGGLGLDLRVDATPNLFFTVGPVAHFLLSDPTVKLTETITTPGSTCQWRDAAGQPTAGKVFTVSSTDSTYTATRIGLEAGVGYKIPLTPSISLVPQLRFQYMLTKLVPDDSTTQIETTRQQTVGTSTYTITDAMLHSLQLGVAVWFRL